MAFDGFYTAKSPAEYAIARNKQKHKNRRVLQELKDKKEAIKMNIERMQEEDYKEAEALILDQINSGMIRVRDLVNGIDLNELAEDYNKNGNIRASCSKYGLAALMTVVNSLHSFDEKNRLVAGKIILDNATGDKKEDAPKSKDLPALLDQLKSGGHL